MKIMLVQPSPIIIPMIETACETLALEYVILTDANALLQRVAEQTPMLIIYDGATATLEFEHLYQKIRVVHQIPMLRFCSEAVQEQDQLYQLKRPISVASVIKKIRQVSQESLVPRYQSDEQVIRGHNWTIHLERYDLTIENEVMTLTRKELLILTILVRNSHQAVSREQLVRSVGEAGISCDLSAIDHQIKKIRKKISKHSTYFTIKTIYRKGYQFLNTNSR